MVARRASGGRPGGVRKAKGLWSHPAPCTYRHYHHCLCAPMRLCRAAGRARPFPM